LLEAIQQTRVGKHYLSPDIAAQLALYNMEHRSSPLDALTARELIIAIQVVRGESAKKISEKLHVTAKTINGYRATIFKKLGIKNNVELTCIALKSGLIQKEETPE